MCESRDVDRAPAGPAPDDRWGSSDWGNPAPDSKLAHNLVAGARLAFFRPVDAGAFQGDFQQIVVLVVTGGALECLLDWGFVEGSSQFSAYGVMGYATHTCS